jgi:hypothetical protein
MVCYTTMLWYREAIREKIMRRIILAFALAGILGVPAKADETLKYRIVQHYTSNQNQQVGDVDRHFMGVARLIGVAFFPDGSTAKTVVVATFDTTLPVGGTANGYGSVTFADGSELWVKWSGTIKIEKGSMTERGTAIVIGGKGRYADAKGDGTWEENTIGTEADAIQIIDNVVNIQK